MSGAITRRSTRGAIRSVRGSRELQLGHPRRLQRAIRLTIPAIARFTLRARLQ